MDEDWIKARLRGIAVREELVDKWNGQNIYENSQKIFDYLPIRRNTLENDYINHLVESFAVLVGSNGVARPFAMMPFHLLFMMALQYKVLRISKEKRVEYELVFTIDRGREREAVLNPESVFDIALLNERAIPDLLKLIDVDGETIKQIKKLIDNRNDNLAHAKGGIESEPEMRIEEYLICLRTIQIHMQLLNNSIAGSWATEVSAEDNIPDFIEARLVDSMLCPEDFMTGKLANDFSKHIPTLIDSAD